MNTVLISAYAVNPYKGSEDGMGWNYIMQAAKYHKIIAVTRHNNRPMIEQYMKEHAGLHQELFNRIHFLYFDWPSWSLFWKKGPFLSMIYYYGWQLTLALWLITQNIKADIVHNLNFHNDWTPSFLWLLKKPFAWGPVGHHPRIPKSHINLYGAKARLSDRGLWFLKKMFWNIDPFLFLTKKKADMTWCMHEDAVARLSLKDKYLLHPSVAASAIDREPLPGATFSVLSVGRFVPLKGFDMAIRSFAAFYRRLPDTCRSTVTLKLVGKGKYRKLLEELAEGEGIGKAVIFREWMTKEELEVTYRESNVFLYPSYEGAGMVVAEAMRYGLPVLCWNNEGPGNIVAPESRLKIDYSDYATGILQFASLLNQLYLDKDFHQRESYLATNHFEDKLDWERKAEQLKAFYDDAFTNYNQLKAKI